MTNLKSTAAIAAFCGVTLMGLPAFALDTEALRAKGEVYVAALYETYQSESAHFASEGLNAEAAFLRAKAESVAAGAELFPLHPMDFRISDASEATALMEAYDETFALVASEAADVAPERIAAVQVAFETWLFSAAENGDEPITMGEHEFRLALDGFVNWSEGTGRFAPAADDAQLRVTQNF